MYLRKDKKCCAAAEKGVRKYERNKTADLKVSEEKRGECIAGAAEEVLLQPLKTILMRLSSCSACHSSGTAARGGPHNKEDECSFCILSSPNELSK